MSLNDTTCTVRYTADGAAQDFPFEFDAINANWLLVSEDNEIVDHGRFTVILNAGEGASGGHIHFLTPPASGKKIVISRDVPFSQLASFPKFSAISPENIEKAYDKNMAVCQQMRDDIARCVKTLPASDVDPDELVEQLFQASEDAVAAAASAAASESAAASSATAAEASKNTAQTRAGEAFSSAASAAQSENNAAQSENNALASKNAAANSATAAAQSASSALESKNAAAYSAIAAAASETNASASALSASASENAAANAADAAHDYAEQAKVVSGITEHNADENAHPAIRQRIAALENGKLAISGGSMTGPVSFTERGKIGSIGNGSAVDLMGGSDLTSGGNVRVFGNGYGGDNAGGVAIFVTNDNGTDAGALRIQRGGITWNGKLLVTTAAGQKRPDYAHLEDITGTYFNAQSAAGFSGYTIDFDGWIFARPTRNENRQVALVSGTTSINFACRQASEACHWGIVPVKNGDKLIVYTNTNDNYGYYYGKVIPTIYTTESSMYVQIIKVPEV